MLRYPQSTVSQQALLAPLVSLTNQVPALEQWITFMTDVEAVYDSLSVAALTNLASIARSIANVCDYLYSASAQSIFSSQYLLQLSVSARLVTSSASLSAQSAPGGAINISLTQAAQAALNTLSKWDPVQGLNVPAHPEQLANALMLGVTVS